MTEALAATFAAPVERAGWAGLLLGLLQVLLIARRRPAPIALALPLPAALVALGAGAALVRDHAVGAGVAEVPEPYAPAFVATAHAGAMRAAGWSAAVAALVLALSALANRPARGPVLPEGLGGLLTGLLLLGAVALGASEALFAAVPALLAALALGRAAPADPSRALAAVALAVAAVGGAIAADGAVYRVAALARPEDLAALDPVIVGRLLALLAVATGLAAALAALLRAGSRAADLAAVGLALVLVAGLGGRGAALAHGPPERLADLALPTVRAEPPFRVSSGCLLRHAEGGWEATPIGRGRCPARALPGGFGPGERPLLALPPDAPAHSLAGWTGPRGSAAALVRLDDGGGLPQWRVAQIPIATWTAPVGGRFRHGGPPAAVLAWKTDDLAAAVGEGRRVDVLFLPTATVGEVLAGCAAVARPAVGCGVALGDPAAWERWAAAR